MALSHFFFLGVALIPRDQAIQVITERPISAEGPFVEKALDTAAQAHLVAVALGTDWPAHLAVPAAAENQNGSTGNSSRNQA